MSEKEPVQPWAAKEVVRDQPRESGLIGFWKRKTGKTGRTIAAFCLIANIIIVAIPTIWMAVQEPVSEDSRTPALDLFGDIIGFVIGIALILIAIVLVTVFAFIGLSFAIDGFASSKTQGQRWRAIIYMLLHMLTIAIPTWMIFGQSMI